MMDLINGRLTGIVADLRAIVSIGLRVLATP